jgi:hypothetical protein
MMSVICGSRYPHCLADATVNARYHLKPVFEGNFITKNIAVRYQLYVIGGSQADDYHHKKLGMSCEIVVPVIGENPLSFLWPTR